MSSLTKKIVECLSLPEHMEGVHRVQIDKHVGANKKSVNKALYELENIDIVEHISESPPIWKLKDIPRPAAAEQSRPDGTRFPKSESASVTDSKETSAKDQTRNPNDDVRFTDVPGADSVTESLFLSENKPTLSLSNAACAAGRIMVPVSLAPALTQQGRDLLTIGEDCEETLSKDVSSMTISQRNTEIPYDSPESAQLSPITGVKAEDESKVIEILKRANGKPVPRKDIQDQIGRSKKTANQLLNSLRDQGKVTRVKSEPPEWTLTKSCQDEIPSPDMTKEDLKKSVDNTIGPEAMTTLTSASNMVVMICSKSTQGTGFFVGSLYLMTAAHVLKAIQNGESLSEPDVLAVINYDSKFSTRREEHQKLHFDGWFWMDEKLDVAILRMKDHLKAASPTLNRYFGSRRPVDEQSLYIIGHENGGVKKTDLQASVRSPSSQHLEALSADQQQPEDFIFYSTVFKNGTSGAPVFVKSGDSVELVAIHLRSYKLRKPHEGSKKKSLRAGLRIAVAGNAMKGSEPDIYKEIFNY